MGDQTSTVRDQVFRFGEFEADPASGELRKFGIRVRLERQPFKILLALLERPAELISREELKRLIAPEADFGDFEHAINVAMAKLRAVLNDQKAPPRYIETLHKRGYRFVAPVECVCEIRRPDRAAVIKIPSAPVVRHNVVLSPEPVPPREPVAGVGAAAASPLQAKKFEVPVRPTASTVSSSRPALRWRLLVAAALLALLMGTASWFLRPAQTGRQYQVHPVATNPGLQTDPALSPDGVHLAFAWTGEDSNQPFRIYVKDVGEEKALAVSDPPAGASDSAPVWSPDGRHILFYRKSAGLSGIYEVSDLGGAERRLVETHPTVAAREHARFDLSPDGLTLVFPTGVAGQGYDSLSLMNLQTGEIRELTFPPAKSGGDSYPVYAPDGKTIAFQRASLDMIQVYVVAASGGEPRQLTTAASNEIYGLAWSPDGEDVLVGGEQLRRIRVSRTPQKATIVTGLPRPVLRPSVRGNRLLYARDQWTANIWKWNLSDDAHVRGEPVPLIQSTHQNAAASMSPDGTEIVFQSDRSGSWEIWKTRRDGSNAQRLTNFKGCLTGTPRWSPDGRLIAFDARPDGKADIFVVSAQGGIPRQLTNSPANEAVPAWSRDGQWIYYSTDRDGAMQIWKMPANGGGPEQQVTHLGGIYAVESFDGQTLYYSKSGSDGTVWRVPVNGGLEERVLGMPTPVDNSHWTISRDGIYLVDRNADLFFYSFATQQTTKVAHHPNFLTDWSMSLSADGRELLWAQIDTRTEDLMMVENFE